MIITQSTEYCTTLMTIRVVVIGTVPYGCIEFIYFSTIAIGNANNSTNWIGAVQPMLLMLFAMNTFYTFLCTYRHVHGRFAGRRFLYFVRTISCQIEFLMDIIYKMCWIPATDYIIFLCNKCLYHFGKTILCIILLPNSFFFTPTYDNYNHQSAFKESIRITLTIGNIVEG